MKFKSNNLGKKNTLYLILCIWQNLNRSKKRYCLIGLILMILSGLLESVSIISVIPFLSIITGENELRWLSFIESIYPNIEYERQIILISIFFIFIVICSAIIRLINLRFTTKIAAAIGHDFSKKAIKTILYQPYIKHINRNSSEIIQTLTTEVTMTVTVISSVLTLLSSTILSLSLLITIFAINWKLALTSTSLFISCFLIIGIQVKAKLRGNGYKTSYLRESQVSNIQESLGGMRSVIINNLQPHYIGAHNSVDFQLRNLNADNDFLNNFPRYLLEIIGIIFLISISFVLGAHQNNDANTIALIGTFALASQKIIPSFQQIYVRWAMISTNTKATLNVLNILSKPYKINNFQSNNKPQINLKEIKFSNVDFKYDKSQQFSLSDINLSIEKGSILGICGKTGSGKSTLTDLFMGLLQPSKGSITINGKDINLNKNFDYLKKWQASISNVPQEIFLADASIAQNIVQASNFNEINYKKLKSCVERSKLKDYIASLNEGLETVVGERGIRLSGGQKQRIGIARALYKGSSVIVLDEATSALDYETESEIMDSIYSLRGDITIIIIAHRLRTLRKCTNIINLENGKIKGIHTPQNSPELFF